MKDDQKGLKNERLVMNIRNLNSFELFQSKNEWSKVFNI